MTRVLVVEAHELVRRGLCQLLNGLGEVHLVSAVASCREASVIVDEVDVVIVASDTDRRALDALRRATRDMPLLAVVRGTGPEHLAAAAHLHADGYILESELEAALGSALGLLLSGQLRFPPELSTWLIESHDRATAASKAYLSDRERQVLEILAEGASNKQIARRLGVTEHGVKHHVGNILAKLNAPNRLVAVTIAISQGLLPEFQPGNRPGVVAVR